MVDHLALEHQGDPHRLIRLVAVDPVPVIKDPVLSQMDVILRKNLVIPFQLFLVEVENVALEKPAVVRHRDVNIGSQIEQGGDQGGGNVGQSTRFRRHSLSHVTHPRRQVGDLRSDNKNSWIAGWGFDGHWNAGG